MTDKPLAKSTTADGLVGSQLSSRTSPGTRARRSGVALAAPVKGLCPWSGAEDTTLSWQPARALVQYWEVGRGSTDDAGSGN